MTKHPKRHHHQKTGMGRRARQNLKEDQVMTFSIGQRIEIPAHYDLWMRGARFGEVIALRPEYCAVKMDHPQIERPIKLWADDWDYAKAI